MEVPAPEVAAPPTDAPSPNLRRRVLRLAWPVIAENLLQTLLGIVDTLLVARLGAAALAGVGTGVQLTFFLMAVLAAVTIGASILVAHAAGARDGRRTIQLAKQALSWGVLLSIPLSIGLVALADPTIAVFGVSPDVAAIGADYWRVTAGTSILLMLMLTASAVLRSVGDARTPMVATMLANVVNAVAAYLLIFGGLGLPALGPVGSAWAASLGRLVGAIVLLVVLYRGRDLLVVRGLGGWRPDFSVARRVFQLGIPAATEQILISLSFVALTAVVATLGTDALAAQRLAFTAMSVAFLPGIGFSIAATALVGQSLGARRPADAAGAAAIASRWAAFWMGALAAVYAVFGEPIMRVFSDDPLVIAFGADSFKIMAIALPFFGISFVQSGALRGAGNTNYPLWINTIGFWLAVGMAALAVGPLHLSLIGAWGAYVIVTPAIAFAVWRRFQRDDWQQVRLAPA